MATIKRVYLENLVDSGTLKHYELVKERQKTPSIRLIWANLNRNSTNELVQNLDVFSLVSVTLVSDKDKPLSFKATLNSPI